MIQYQTVNLYTWPRAKQVFREMFNSALAGTRFAYVPT